MNHIDELLAATPQATPPPASTDWVPIWNLGQAGSSYGTTLPASPTDGQVAVLVDSLTAPTYSWQLQWSAAAARWLYMGGSAGWSVNTATSTTTSAAYVDLTNNVSFAFPRAGSYQIDLRCAMWVKTGGQTGWCGIKVGAAATPDTDAAFVYDSGSQIQISTSQVKIATGVLAGDIVKLQFKVQGGAVLQVDVPKILITPVALT